MRIIRCVVIIFFASATLASFAQPSFFTPPDSLQKGGALPEGLQSTRSAVFIKIDHTVSLDSTQWYEMAQLFHRALVDLHIDAVVYYRWRDLNAGLDASESYKEALAAREVNQILLLEVGPGSYQIYIVPSSTEDDEIFSIEQQAWHISGTTLENATTNLTQVVNKAGLEIANFLISESPEFFIDTPIFKKNRFESFQPDLKLDKLAVPLFNSEDPEQANHPSDLEIQAIFKNQYPFEYQIVGAGMSEDLMRKAGFQYVLRYLTAEESTLLTLLDYPFSSEAPGKFGFKFYFKHLITGDIYLGDDWDGRSSWQQALTGHLSSMKRSLKVE